MSKTAVYTRHEDWVEASSSRRPWGANAGSGALALCVAAAPGSGIGNCCSVKFGCFLQGQLLLGDPQHVVAAYLTRR